MTKHACWYPPDLDRDAECKGCHEPWPCDGARWHQSRCGCWQTSRPKRHPWYYKPGDWTSWRPVSLGGDEWCRRTLVVGFGRITGVLVIPLRECRGCEDCGTEIVDGVPCGAYNSPYPLKKDAA